MMSFRWWREKQRAYPALHWPGDHYRPQSGNYRLLSTTHAEEGASVLARALSGLEGVVHSASRALHDEKDRLPFPLAFNYSGFTLHVCWKLNCLSFLSLSLSRSFSFLFRTLSRPT